jgi:hypothetical protein
MKIFSLRKRFEKYCAAQEKHRKASVESIEELQKQCGYVDVPDGLWLGFWESIGITGPAAPAISIAQRLTAIEKHLGIEVVRTEAEVNAKPNKAKPKSKEVK